MKHVHVCSMNQVTYHVGMYLRTMCAGLGPAGEASVTLL
jgi:hypothetical protein